jgi:hypothetical protein
LHASSGPPSGGQTGTRSGPGSFATTHHDTALPQALTGPRAAVRDRNRTGAGRIAARRETEVHTMATMTKLRDKIERFDALKGWRMRWYMQ